MEMHVEELVALFHRLGQNHAVSGGLNVCSAWMPKRGLHYQQ